MESKGVMQQIREHLTEGRSSTDVTALGYAPSTVFKVQRQIRRRTRLNLNRSLETGHLVSAMAKEDTGSTLVAKDEKLRAEIEHLRQQVKATDNLSLQLDKAQATTSKLERSNEKLARDLDAWMERSRDLESRFNYLNRTCYKCRQPLSNHWWCGNQRSCPTPVVTCSASSDVQCCYASLPDPGQLKGQCKSS